MLQLTFSRFLSDQEKQFFCSFWTFLLKNDFGEQLFLLLSIIETCTNKKPLLERLRLCYLILERMDKIKEPVLYELITEKLRETKDNGKKINYSELLKLLPETVHVSGTGLSEYKGSYSINDLCKHFDKSRPVIYKYFERGLKYYLDADNQRKVKGEDLRQFEQKNFTFNVSGTRQIKDKRKFTYI